MFISIIQIMQKLLIVIFILSFFNVSAQLQLGNSKHYARALCMHNKTLFVGFSDGELYAVDPKKEQFFQLDAPKSLVEIRDLQVWNDELYVMESSDSSELWKMNLKTKTWTQIKLIHDAVFLDDLIATKQRLYLFGDAVNDSLVIYSVRGDSTVNEAKFAHGLPTGKIALFAASGSAVQRFTHDFGLVYQKNGSQYVRFIPGKHFFWETSLPLLKVESGGAFSQVIFDRNKSKYIALVGGDYLNPNRKDSIACYSIDAGKTFLLSESQPAGYRSHVIHVGKGKLIAVGPTGIDISNDGGKNWHFVQAGKFHAVVSYGKKVFVTSNEGKLVVYNWKTWFKKLK